MKKTLLCVVPCLLLGTGIFFVVNHAARARLIVAAVGELPNIPGCPLHASCVKALQQEKTLTTPLFPAVIKGLFAGAAVALLAGAALTLLRRMRVTHRRFAPSSACVLLLMVTLCFTACDGLGEKIIDDPPLEEETSLIENETSPLLEETHLIEMVQIKAGNFYMGSPDGAVGRPYVSGQYGEKQHLVILTQDFYMGKYEVTQKQYETVMGTNPSRYNGGDNFTASGGTVIRKPYGDEIQDNRPVENVSWYDVLVFCNKLSIMEGLTPAYSISGETDPDKWGAVPTVVDKNWDTAVMVEGSTGYRLPTEAQWEYACRAGTNTSLYITDIPQYSGHTTQESVEYQEGLKEYIPILNSIAWNINNSDCVASNRTGYGTHEVGKKIPNNWGLYDMCGNVAEWCWDGYEFNYGSSIVEDPMGPEDRGLYHNRVWRGGSFWHGSYSSSAVVGAFDFFRSAQRSSTGAQTPIEIIGFRVVRPVTVAQ